MAEQNPRRFQRLLVPLDGSSMAASVLPTTQFIATRLGAEVVLLHVLEARPPAHIHGDRHLRQTDEAEAYLQEVSGPFRQAGIPVSSHVHDAPEGDVARSIVSHADEFAPDLVVLCAHGDGGLRGLLYGNIAQQVLRRGSWPILLLHPNEAEEAPHFNPCRILLPLDAKHPAEEAIEATSAMASAFDADIDLTVVTPTLATLSRERAGSGLMLPHTMRALLQLTHEDNAAYLQEVAGPLTARGLVVHTHVAQGDAVSSVPDIADALDVDLVVMASHGRAGLNAILSDSVAPKIVARIRRPLLLLKAH